MVKFVYRTLDVLISFEIISLFGEIFTPMEDKKVHGAHIIDKLF